MFGVGCFPATTAHTKPAATNNQMQGNRMNEKANKFASTTPYKALQSRPTPTKERGFLLL